MSRDEEQEITLSDFDRIMQLGQIEREACVAEANQQTTRINVDDNKEKNGLGQLVLAVVNLLHELLEKQAIRRMDAGTLTDEEIERLGVALMGQAQEIDRLRQEFNLEEEDLNLDLGPLGTLLK